MDGSGAESSSEEEDLREVPAQYKLERHLMRYYNHRLIPRRNTKKPISVKFRVALYQIVELNEPQQYIMLVCLNYKLK